MAMLAEFTPRKFSARLNTWQGLWYTAVSLNLILAIVFFQMGTGDSIWRYLLGTCGVVALVLLILQSCYLVESPTWQARKNRLAGAARSMSKIYGQSFIAEESPIGELQGPPTASRGLKNLKLIFRGIYLPRTILATTVQLVQSVQYFGVGWYLPIIAVALFGSDFIFNTVGTLVFNVFGIVGGFASAWLSAKIGQRIASKWGFLIVFIVLVIFGFAYDTLPLWLGFALPSLFILCHSIGPAANGKSLSSLSFRSEIRATANGFIGAIGSFGAALGLLIFPLLQDAFGLGPTFLIVAIFPLAAFIVCTVITWEPTRAEVHVDEETDAPQFV